MDINSIVQDGFKSVESKLETQLKSAVEKYEGQLQANGQASQEAKDEVKALSSKFESAITDLSQKMTSFGGLGQAAEKKTAGEQLIASPEFKSLLERQNNIARIEVKNTTSSVAGTTVYPQNVPGVIPGQFAPLTVRQILPSGATNAISVVGTREKSFANKAAGVAQAAAKPESDIVFEQIQTPVETIATWLKVSNQLLADAPAVISYIDTRLRYMLEATIDAQLLNGTGVTPQLKGLTVNATAYTATSKDLLSDAINRAKYTLWAAGYTPDAVIVNPQDWAALELTKSTYGTYLYGAPGTVGGTSPFGIPVVLSNNMTAGKFLIGNFQRAAMLWDRQSTTVEAGYVNTDFTSNLVTLRAETRLGLEISVPGAMLFGSFTAA